MRISGDIMAVIAIGDITTAKTIISDHDTPASGVYAWGITAEQQVGAEPRAPIINLEFAAEVNLKEKFFDLTSTFRITNAHITSATYWDRLKDALDYWDAHDTRLYLSVKNEWGVDLATRGTKSDSSDTTITQVKYRGKLFNFRWLPKPAEVLVNVEFHYTTA